MSSEPILICHDGSQSAEHSFHAAAAPVLIVPPSEPHPS
jgi:hypothetical protein